MNREIIKNYDNYEIFENGKIINKKTGKTKKPTIANNGYYVVDLFKNNKRKTFLLHRLIAETFIPNPNDYPCINHIDENKLNNNINNLEWCTYKYNINYSQNYKSANIVTVKKVNQIKH